MKENPKVRNWSEYNKALKKRGAIIFASLATTLLFTIADAAGRSADRGIVALAR